MNTYIHPFLKLEGNTGQNFSSSQIWADKHHLMQLMHLVLDHQRDFRIRQDTRSSGPAISRVPDPSRNRNGSLAHYSPPFSPCLVMGSMVSWKKPTFPHAACLACGHVTQLCLLEVAFVICGGHSHGKTHIFLWPLLPAAVTQWEPSYCSEVQAAHKGGRTA